MSVGRGRGMTLPAWMAKQDPAAAASLGGSAPGGLSNGSSGYGAPPQPPQPPQFQQQQQQQYQPPPPIPGQFTDAAPQHHHQQQQQQQQHSSGGGGYGGPPQPPAAVQYMRRSPERAARPPGVRGRVHSSHTGPQAVAAGNYSQSSRKNRHSRSTSADRDRRDIRRKRRKERGTNFDVLPEGMDEATANQIAAQAFLQQTMPSVAAAVSLAASGGAAAGGLGIPGGQGGAGSAAQSNPAGLLAPPSVAPSMQQTRHARRLYVGNIPRISEEEVQKFFEDVLDRALGYRIEGGPVVSVYLNTDRGFAFVELKSVALTTAAMQLDGISMGDIQLKIRRPSDYNAAAVPPEANTETVSLNLAALGIISTTVPDGPNKVFIGGLPYHLTEEQVKELLSAFGPLKALHLVKEAGASNSKGYGFCEYVDPDNTAIACQGLNGMALGEKTLTVRSAQSAAEQQIAPLPNNGGGISMSSMAPLQHIQLPSGMSMQSIGGVAPSEAEQLMLAQAMAGLDPNANAAANAAAAAAAAAAASARPVSLEAAAAASTVRAMAPTRVLVLLNMVSEGELLDDQEYSDVSTSYILASSYHITIMYWSA
jgi:splicing factor U2AF 65 kDa subunit